MGLGSDQDPSNGPPLEPPVENIKYENGYAANRHFKNNLSNPSSGFSPERNLVANEFSPPTARQPRRLSFLDPNLVPPSLGVPIIEQAAAYQQSLNWQNSPSSPPPRSPSRFHRPFSGTRGGHRGSRQLVSRYGSSPPLFPSSPATPYEMNQPPYRPPRNQQSALHQQVRYQKPQRMRPSPMRAPPMSQQLMGAEGIHPPPTRVQHMCHSFPMDAPLEATSNLGAHAMPTPAREAPPTGHPGTVPPPMAAQAMYHPQTVEDQQVQYPPPVDAHQMQYPPPVDAYQMQYPPPVDAHQVYYPPPVDSHQMEYPPQVDAYQMQYPPPGDAHQIHYAPLVDPQNIHYPPPVDPQDMHYPPPLDGQEMQQIHCASSIEAHQFPNAPPMIDQPMNYPQVGHPTMGYAFVGYTQEGYLVVPQPMQLLQYEAQSNQGPTMGREAPTVRDSLETMLRNGVPPNPGSVQAGSEVVNETKPENQSNSQSCQQPQAAGYAEQIYKTPSFSPQSMFSGPNSFAAMMNSFLEVVQHSGSEIHARLDGQSEEFRSLHKKLDMITNFLRQDVLPVVDILKGLKMSGNGANVLAEHLLQGTENQDCSRKIGELLSNTAADPNDEEFPSDSTLPENKQEDVPVALVSTLVVNSVEKKEMKKSKAPQNQPVVLLKREQKEQPEQHFSAPSEKKKAADVSKIPPEQENTEEISTKSLKKESEDENRRTVIADQNKLETADGPAPEVIEEHGGTLGNKELVNTPSASLDVLEKLERQHENEVTSDEVQAPEEPTVANPRDKLAIVHESESAPLYLSDANSETGAQSAEKIASEKNKKEKKKEKKSSIDNDRMSRKLKAFEKMNRCAEMASRGPKLQKKTKNNEKGAPKPHLSIPPANQNPEQENDQSADCHSNEAVGIPVKKPDSIERGSIPGAGSSIEKNLDSSDSGNAKAVTTGAVDKLKGTAGSGSLDEIMVHGDAQVDPSSSVPCSSSTVPPETSSQESCHEPSQNDNDLELGATGNELDQSAAKKMSKKQKKKKLQKSRRAAARVQSDKPEEHEKVESVSMEEFEEVTDPEEIEIVMNMLDYWSEEMEEENDSVECAKGVEKSIDQLEELLQPDKSTATGSLNIQPDRELEVSSSKNEMTAAKKERDREGKKSEGTLNDQALTTSSIKNKDFTSSFSIEKLLETIDSESSKQEKQYGPNTEAAEKEDQELLAMMLCLYKYTKNININRRWFNALAFKSGKGNFFNMEPGSRQEKIALYWRNRPLKKWTNSDCELFIKCCLSKVQKYGGMEGDENKKLRVFFRALMQFVLLPRSEQPIPRETLLEDVTFFENQEKGKNNSISWDLEYLELVESISESFYVPIRFPPSQEVKACSASKLNETHINNFLVYLQRQDTLRHSSADVELMSTENQVLCELRQMETSDETFDAQPFFIRMLADLKKQRPTIKNFYYKNCYEFLLETGSDIVAADLYTLMKLGLAKEKRNNQSNHKVCMNLWFGIQ